MIDRPTALLTALLLAGCTVQVAGQADVATKASPGPKASGSPKASAAPKAPAGPTMAGAWTLTYDPPMAGDSGLGPDGPTSREVSVALQLRLSRGKLIGEATWCPSDYCAGAAAEGVQAGERLTLTIAGQLPQGGAGKTELVGSLGVDGAITGDVKGAQARTRFKLVRAALDLGASPTPLPSFTPVPPREALQGLWSPVRIGEVGPSITVDPCGPYGYRTYTFDDPEGDGKDVKLAIRTVAGRFFGTPLSADLVGARGTGDAWTFTGTRLSPLQVAGGGSLDRPIKLTFRLDAAAWRLEHTGAEDGVDALLAPAEVGARPAAGCPAPADEDADEGEGEN